MTIFVLWSLAREKLFGFWRNFGSWGAPYHKNSMSKFCNFAFDSTNLHHQILKNFVLQPILTDVLHYMFIWSPDFWKFHICVEVEILPEGATIETTEESAAHHLIQKTCMRMHFCITFSFLVVLYRKSHVKLKSTEFV